MRPLKWARGKIRENLGFIAQFSFFQHAHFFANVQFAQIVQFNGTGKYSTNGNGTGKCRAERMVLRNAPWTRMVLRNAGNSCGPGAQNNVIRLRWSPRRDIRSVCGAFDRQIWCFDIWGDFSTFGGIFHTFIFTAEHESAQNMQIRLIWHNGQCHAACK